MMNLVRVERLQAQLQTTANKCDTCLLMTESHVSPRVIKSLYFPDVPEIYQRVAEQASSNS